MNPATKATSTAKSAARRVDTFQEHRPWLAFPYAVVRKFGEDQAGNLAALIAYYGFFSVFPLLLVLVTVLGMVLRGHPGLEQRVLGSALAQFPVIGTQIQRNVHSLQGGGLALVIGIVLTLWSGLGVVKATETAMNTVWNVPYRKRPNFIFSTLRALLMLAVLGVITLAAAVVGGVGAGSGSWLRVVAGLMLSLALNFALFLLAFKILTAAPVAWDDLWIGAALGAVAWTVLQALGGYYVSHQLRSASEVYGAFGTVIGLLAWIYLGAQITLLGAEVNVVRARRLWPRSLVQEPPPTEADRRALGHYAEQEERRHDEDVHAAFNHQPDSDPEPESESESEAATGAAGTRRPAPGQRPR
jgi:YihY family inner membrane protein